MLVRDDKNSMIYVSGIIGFLEDKQVGKQKTKEEVLAGLEKLLSEIVLKSKATEKEIQTLLKDIERGKYKVTVVTDADIKRRINEQKEKVVRIRLDELDDIREHCLEVCKGCTRSKKHCALRKTLLKLKTPPMHYERGKCEFDPQ